MQLYGIGQVTSEINKNNITLFFGNKLLVISFKKLTKIKFYYYNESEHKPDVKFVLGLTKEIYPDTDELDKY